MSQRSKRVSFPIIFQIAGIVSEIFLSLTHMTIFSFLLSYPNLLNVVKYEDISDAERLADGKDPKVTKEKDWVVSDAGPN